MWWGTALVLPCVALPQSIKQSQSPRRAPDMVVYAVRRQSKWLHMGLAAAKSQMSPHPIHTPRCVTVLLEGRRHRRDIFSLPSSVGQRGVCPSAGASGSPDVTAGRHSDCLRGWQCERGQKRRKKEETGRRHNLRIQYIQLTSCLSQISRHSMKKKVRVEFMASTIGRDLAISNLMDRGGSEKAKAEPMEGALASFPPSPHASKKGGADGSFLFIPCLARISPVSRSHDLQRQRPSPPRPPRLCHVSKVCWFGWLQQKISSCLGMVTWRPAGATVTLCIAILTHHGMVSQHCFWGFSSNTAPILHGAQRRGLVEGGSQVSTSISGFSRRTTHLSTVDVRIHFSDSGLQDLAITAPSPCRVIRETTTTPGTTSLR
jgi:hypothetical protein